MLTQLLHEDNHCLTRTAASEYHGACPWCGGDDRFMIFADRDKYFCRQCNSKGDSIQYLREFRKLDYFTAAGIVGIQIPARQKEPSPYRKVKGGEGWLENATALVQKAKSYLKTDSTIMDELQRTRGITAATVDRFNLGWLRGNIFDSRAAWGLPDDVKEDGQPKKLFIPAGLVIPSPDMKRIRVRRSEPGMHRKYFEVPGSNTTQFVINAHLGTDRAAAIIVESELDAILLCQELKDKFVIVATGGASNGPSDELLEDMRRRMFVLVSLDSDAAGAKAAWAKWLIVLRNAVRAPVPPSMGKDHGEAYKNGLDLNQWLSAAYEIVMGANTEASSCVKT